MDRAVGYQAIRLSPSCFSADAGPTRTAVSIGGIPFRQEVHHRREGRQPRLLRRERLVVALQFDELDVLVRPLESVAQLAALPPGRDRVRSARGPAGPERRGWPPASAARASSPRSPRIGGDDLGRTRIDLVGVLMPRVGRKGRDLVLIGQDQLALQPIGVARRVGHAVDRSRAPVGRRGGRRRGQGGVSAQPTPRMQTRFGSARPSETRYRTPSARSALILRPSWP